MSAQTRPYIALVHTKYIHGEKTEERRCVVQVFDHRNRVQITWEELGRAKQARHLYFFLIPLEDASTICQPDIKPVSTFQQRFIQMLSCAHIVASSHLVVLLACLVVTKTLKSSYAESNSAWCSKHARG